MDEATTASIFFIVGLSRYVMVKVLLPVEEFFAYRQFLQKSGCRNTHR